MFPASTQGQIAAPSKSLEYPFILASGYYVYFPVDAFANATVVQYSLMSNASISTAFMTSAQLQDFNSSQGTISNSITYQNGTSSSRTLRVRPGSYDLLAYAYDGTANGTVSLTVFPNNPFSSGPLTAPEPSGIATYGIANQSGIDTPYTVVSTDVIGLAVISSLDAYNSTAESVGTNPSGATLQLNSVLVVDERGGGSQVYWCQNTPDFVTSAFQVALADNVWNYSADGFLSNGSITSQGGGGFVSTFQQNGMTEYYYAYGETNSSYSLPLGIVLLVNATAEPGTGVLVQFGAKTTGSGLGTNWFDNVTIHDPTVRSAYFLTSGNSTTPIGSFYDTELVFAGEGNGETTDFTHLSASLGLFYANGTSASVNAFPSYFSFGQDTAESADNLRMSYLGNGEVHVSVGTPNYDYLGAASESFTLSAAESSLGFPGSSNVTSTSNTGRMTTAISSVTTTQGSGNGIPEFPIDALMTTALVVLIIFSYLLARRQSDAARKAARC